MVDKILTVGYEIPGHSDWHLDQSSKQSLLDADIMVFQADLSGYTRTAAFQGKPRIDNNESFKLQEDSRYWQGEISTALDAGKTVFVFFRQVQEVLVYTGKDERSGTGVSNVLAIFDNYQFLPIKLPTIVPKEGKEILFSGSPVFSSFWTEFGKSLKYESYLDGKVANPLFVTRTGEKVVGALFRVGKGNLVLLPPVDYDKNEFKEYSAKKHGWIWTPEAQGFGDRLVQVLVAIDKTLRTGEDRTPPPDWTSDECFQLAEEARLKNGIGEKDRQIDDLVMKKNEMLMELDQTTRLRDLLFEKGKNLENAVILALKILGYDAENYHDKWLEVDQVILSPEGQRFIGETEGKDTSAVNIDKFRQLTSNVHEDLRREEVASLATGILFGNGFRLSRPSERAEQFTEKCMNTAQSLNCILVRTSDLFRVAKYVQETRDASFAGKCRNAISSGIGRIVDFPSNPAAQSLRKPVRL